MGMYQGECMEDGTGRRGALVHVTVPWPQEEEPGTEKDGMMYRQACREGKNGKKRGALEVQYLFPPSLGSE